MGSPQRTESPQTLGPYERDRRGDDEHEADDEVDIMLTMAIDGRPDDRTDDEKAKAKQKAPQRQEPGPIAPPPPQPRKILQTKWKN